MADDIARLVAVLEADLKGFTKGMEQAQRIADQRFGAIEKKMRATESLFASSFQRIGGLVAGFFSVRAVVGFVESIISAADALKDTSDQLGISTRELQGLNSAARDTGAGTDRMKQGLASLSDQLGDAAKGEGNLAKMMRELKIPLGTTMQVLFDLADATKAAATQNEKMTIATTAFGKAGKELVPLLNQGADGIHRLFEEAQRKGQIWDPETVAKLDRLKDSWEALKVSFTGKIANPLAGFFEYIQGLTPAIDKLQDQLRRIEREPGGASRPSAQRLRAQIDAINAAVPFRGTPLLPAGVARTVVPETKADRDKEISEAKRIAEAAKKIRDDIYDHYSMVAERITTKQYEAAQEEGRINEDIVQHYIEMSERLTQVQLDALKQFHDDANAVADEFSQRNAEDIQKSIDEAGKESIETIDQLRGSLSLVGAAGVRSFSDIGDAAKQAAQQLATMIFQLTVMEPLLRLLTGERGQPLGGILGSLFPSLGASYGFPDSVNITPGKFAGGGRPPMNRWSIVGENGPEWFKPDTAGIVIPSANARGGGMNLTIQNVVQLAGANGDQTIREYARRGAVEGAALAVSHIRKNLPGMMVNATQRSL